MSLALIYARSASGDIQQIIAQKNINEAKAIENDWETENMIESGVANTARITEAIESGRIGVIYATEPSRITRDAEELLIIHRLADKHGVRIKYTRAADIDDSETATLLANVIMATINFKE